MNKRVCIIGTASSMNKTPFEDKSFDFWACSPVPTYPEFRDKNYALLFEMHDESYWGQKPVLERLNEAKCPIMMKKKNAAVKKSERFPYEELVDHFGRKYFTSTISFMVAYAIMQGYKEIHLYGVHMSASEEYGSQRQACEYWLGRAEGLGITVYIPSESEILHTPYIYGYETENDVVAQARIRRTGLMVGVEQFEQKKIDKLIELNQKIGKLSILQEMNKNKNGGYEKDIEELSKGIQQNKFEVKEIEKQINKNLGAVSEDEFWIRRYSYSGKLQDPGK